MIFKKNMVKRSLPRKIGNGIIAFFVSIFILLFLFFAFSQTSTFREILRKKVVEIANDAINGKISIGKLEGTLITHLVLRNVSLENNSDTMLVAKKIELALNPFYILVKKIKVTKLTISDAKISLLEIEPDFWNYTNLVKPDTTEEDTSKSVFPLLVDISDFSLENISFKYKRNQYLNNYTKYETINYDDLEFENLNLQVDILADFKKNDYEIDISKLSFSPNLTNFKLNDFNGKISINQKFAHIDDLTIITEKSSLNLSASLDNLNIFEDVELSNFRNYPIKFKLIGEPFNADDLNSFLGALNFMRGEALIDFEGDGVWGDFNFASTLQLDKTTLNLDGNVTNLDNPSELYIKAKFVNSKLTYSEIDNFLVGLDLPKYPKLEASGININFEGEPLKFNLDGKFSVGRGSVKFDSFMDITKKLIEYDYKVKTQNLNLASVLEIETRLNAEAVVKGRGFDPSESSSKVTFSMQNSVIEGHNIDTANVILNVENKLVDVHFYSQIDSMQNELNGNLNLENDEKPRYSLIGSFKNLDLFDFTQNSELISSLNFNFDITGHSLDLDKTEGEFNIVFNNSTIGSNELDNADFKINLSKVDSTRIISFKSPFLDFNISGNFLIDETVNLLLYQTEKIGYAIKQKLNEMNPVNISADTSNTLAMLLSEKSIAQKNIYLDYDFNFKDFKLIAALLNRDQFEVSGSGYGYLENNAENFTLSTTINLDWLFLYKGKDVFYISGVETGFDIGANNNNYKFDNIFGSFSLKTEEMVSNFNINNIRADLIFNQSKGFLNLEANLDDKFDVGTEGIFTFTDTSEILSISNIFFTYNDYLWQNKDTIYIANSNSLFDIKNFNLYNNKSKLSINGSILNKNIPNIKIDVTDLDGVQLTNQFLETDVSLTKFDINATASIKGTLNNPIYDTDFSVEDIQIKNNYLGSLYGKIDFVDNNIVTKIELLDTLKNSDNKILTLVGNIPMRTISGNSTNNSSTDNMNLKFRANGFNLASFGNAIPTIINPSGIVNSDISIIGSWDNLNFSGYFNANNFKFTSALSNLDYLSTVNLVFNDKNILLQNSFIKNDGKTNYPGQMIVSGKILMEGFGINTADISLDGNIALLSPSTREVMPNFFGDFQIKSDKPWHLKYSNKKSSFVGDIVLEEVNLNFIPTESSYSVTNSDFKYIFITDSTSSDLQRLKRSKMLSALSLKSESGETDTLLSNFDYNIKLKSPNISKLSVILSKALNQKLLADITGELQLKNINNQFSSQGQFDILSSSMFTFYKTFSAEGNIKFTSDLTNPIVSLTSTYISEYINPRDESAEPIKTAVKIKIDDSAQSIIENMASGKKPLEMRIYSGEQNIEYDVPNPQYSNLDAMYFIIFGSFSSDTENANIAKSAGYSMLGSAFTSVLNARFGNIFNNVNINQTGKSTRFNVSGSIQQFRYTLGSTVEELSDWTQANAKLEYLFNPQLIMRVERKNPVISSSYNTQKTYEFGVMYRFAF